MFKVIGAHIFNLRAYFRNKVKFFRSIVVGNTTDTESVNVEGNIKADGILIGGATITWNSVDGTIDIAYGEVTLQVGQEQHFYAKAIEPISNGDVAMFAGAQGDHLLIRKADVTVPGFIDDWVVGVATQDFDNNEFGYTAPFGKVRGLDTSSFTEGSILYLDPTTPGKFVTARPTAPNRAILVAAVTKSHQVEGTIFVRPSFGFNLNDLYDLDISAAVQNNLIFLDSDGVWRSTNSPTLSSIRLTTKNTIPSNSTTAGQVGLITYDDNYIYIKTGNGWGRVAIDFNFLL